MIKAKTKIENNQFSQRKLHLSHAFSHKLIGLPLWRRHTTRKGTVHVQSEVKETINVQSLVKETVHAQSIVKDTVHVRSLVKGTVHVRSLLKGTVHIQSLVKETVLVQSLLKVTVLYMYSSSWIGLYIICVISSEMNTYIYNWCFINTKKINTIITAKIQ